MFPVSFPQFLQFILYHRSSVHATPFEFVFVRLSSQCERTPASLGVSFLLQREQRY